VRHKSDSSEQRVAELAILQLLSAQTGVSLAPAKLSLTGGATVNIDGFNPDARVLCEIYAHVGRTRGAQPGKVAKDILKMVAAEKALGQPHKKILCFIDRSAAACVLGRSWLAEVAKDLGVDVLVLDIGPELTAQLVAAQKRQVMVNG
jgi:hypothetical protein